MSLANPLGDPLSGAVALSAAGDGGALPINPANVDLDIFGLWLDSATITGAGDNIVITATHGGLSAASEPFDISPNVPPALSLSLPGSIAENSPNVVATVGIDQVPTSNLFVDLTTSDDSMLGFAGPPTVVLLAGQTSATFTLAPQNNSTPELTRTVTIGASVSGGEPTPASGQVVVLDDDPHHFRVSEVPSPQARNVPFGVTVTAEDSAGETLSAYKSIALLSATADDGAAGRRPVRHGPVQRWPVDRRGDHHLVRQQCAACRLARLFERGVEPLRRSRSVALSESRSRHRRG